MLILNLLIALCVLMAVVMLAGTVGEETPATRKAKRVNELIAVGDRIRADLDDCECDLTALGIEDQLEGVANDLCNLEGYSCISWKGKRFRDVILYGDSYEEAKRKVENTCSMERRGS